MNKYLIVVSRLAGGAVFIFSGFVKGIDPVGSRIKFGDYLSAAGITVPDNILLAAAMLLCAAEFITGVMIITNSFYKAGVIAYAVFMAIFTPLTLVLAIFNPVSDCGCFGDAIHLTNWETFFKNMVLLVPGAIMLISIRKKSWFSNLLPEGANTAISLVLFTGFMFYNVAYQPVIDFRPYKPGVNLTEARTIPPGAPQDVYSTTLIYEKGGVQKEFTLENYPADDTSWVFVDQKSTLVKKGYVPPARDFHINAIDGRELTDQILYKQGYSLLMISHNLGKAKRKDIDEGFIMGYNLESSGIDFYVVTASTRDEIDTFVNGLKFSTADGTLLKTIVRSNPGYLLIGNGTILAKWSHNSLPGDEWFSGDITAKALREAYGNRAFMITALFLLAFAASWVAVNSLKGKC